MTKRFNFSKLLGIVLIVSGLTILAWFAWQFYGTNIVSRHNQERNIASIKKDWTKTNSSDSGKRALIRIPRFGKKWEMPIINSVSEEALASGVGHFPSSVGPGEIGNYALAGHRVTHGEPFKDFPSLRKNDKVIIETRTMLYTYSLDTSGSQYIVDFMDGWILNSEPIPLPTDRIITLVTCSELFHTDHRSVVFGHLVSAVPK